MWKALSLLVFLASCSHAPTTKQKTTPRKASVSKVRKAAPVVLNETHESTASVDEKLLKRLSAKNIVIVDVRDINEFVNGHLKGATHVDFLQDNFEGRIAHLDRKKTYLLYCSTGSRSGKALHYFHARKIKAENLGNFDDLKERGAPVEGIEE